MKIESIKQIIDTTVPILGIMRRVNESDSESEGMQGTTQTAGTTTPALTRGQGIIGIVIFILLIIFSLYLHVQCKNRNIFGFIPAICCPWAYLMFYAVTYNLYPFVCPKAGSIPTSTP